MNLLYKLLLTINATSWMGIIYAIKKQWTFYGISPHFFGIVLLFLPVLFSFISLIMAKGLSKDNLAKCLEVSLADGEFLPVYLGYFFVSISVSENWTMLIVFIIVFVFTFVSQTQYFNPLFLLFGYHYYHVLTEGRTQIILIKKGPVARKVTELAVSNLYRINDTTYIERR